MIDKTTEITSVQNNIVKEVTKLHQKKYREDFIIVEGEKSVSEALEAGLNIKYAFSSNKTLLEKFSAKLNNAEVYLANEKVMEKISTTESAPNILAVVKKPEYDISMFKNFKKIVLLDGIKDAGNLGTIIRTAAAFDIGGIMLFGECTDEFSPKTIRSAAGNIFKVPIVHCTAEQLKEFKKSHKMIATVVNSKNSIQDFNVKSPYIVMFGSEACGLCNELLSLADTSLTIPMKEGVESLNLAISTGIVLYEIFKHQLPKSFIA